MKRMIAILLAVMLMSTVFTACAGTFDDGMGMGYGNVSTTPNGYVNGGYNGYNGAYNDYNNGTYNRSSDQNDNNAGRHGNYGGRYYDGTFHGGTNDNRNSTDSNGSGMTGGR